MQICISYGLTKIVTSLAYVVALTAAIAGAGQARAQAAAVSAEQDQSVLKEPELSIFTVRETPPQLLDGSAQLVGHYESDRKLRMVLAIMPPHMAEEEEFLEELHTKGSPNFHKFLTSEEWDARFAPSVDDERKVVEWAESQGLTVTHRFSNRLLVDLEAPAGLIEKAFGVAINRYQVGDEIDYSNDRDPAIPASLAGIVYSVQGLNNIQRMRGSVPGTEKNVSPDYTPGPAYAVGESVHADGDATWLPTESDRLRPNVTNGFLDPTNIYSSQSYNYNALHALGHCCNPNHEAGGSPPETSIGIAAFGGFNSSDILGFHAQYPYLALDYTVFTIDGTAKTPNECSPGTTGCPVDSAVFETTMDLEWSTATSNSFGSYLDTAHVYVYEGADQKWATYTDLYGYMLSDGFARVFTTSWSCTESYGCSDSLLKSWHATFDKMSGMGWTLVAASGDRGATDDCNTGHIAVAEPASDTDFIAAGGTALSLLTNGTYVSEVGWTGGTGKGSCKGNNGGSGGGVSSYFKVPSWQSSFNTSYRFTPDLSLNAAGVGQNVYYNGKLSGGGSGTSIVAPELAGFFAQENAYLLSIGSACGGKGSAPCAPLGNPAPYLYEEGLNNFAPHNPFYDITSGCNSNDITAAGKLSYYCASTGYDQVTGWGSANMLQLAWLLNLNVTAALGSPTVKFSGPAKDKWYSTNQTVTWTVIDNPDRAGTPGSGIAGFTQGWDKIPADPVSQKIPGSGNSFYSGPEFPNATGGCLSLEAGSGCGGGVSEGCHTIHVRAWNNQGRTSGDATYGPICFSNVPPTASATVSPTPSPQDWNNKPVTVTITATASGGAGIKHIYYGVNDQCATTNLSKCAIYGGPLSFSRDGIYTVAYFAEDNAGNFGTSEFGYARVMLDQTPPVTTAKIAGTKSGSNYISTVNITLQVTDNLSDALYTEYQLDGGPVTYYDPGATPPILIPVSSIGKHTFKFWSQDLAGNIEAAHTLTFTVANGTMTDLTATPNPALLGQNILLKVKVIDPLSGTLPTGTVTFQIDGTTIVTDTITPGGVLEVSDNNLAAGKHTVKAIYNPTGSFTASISAAITVVVKPAEETNISLRSSANPSVAGAAVTLTADVNAAISGIPTGSVTFMDGATKLGTGTQTAGGTPIFTFTTTALSAGTHSITAVYSGDTTFAANTSSVLSQKVTTAAAETINWPRSIVYAIGSWLSM